MSTFKVPVEVVTIEPHPNADALEIANIQGFQAIVRKGQFQTGQLIAYIPEAAIVPDDLLESMGLMGALHPFEVWLDGPATGFTMLVSLGFTSANNLTADECAAWIVERLKTK